MATRCNSCGTANDNAAKFCRNCGSKDLARSTDGDASSRPCPSCGAGCKSGARFCLKCGTSLSAAPAAVPVTPVAPAAPEPEIPPRRDEAVVGISSRAASPAAAPAWDTFAHESSPAETPARSPRSSGAYIAMGILVVALVGLGGYFYWSLKIKKESGAKDTSAPTMPAVVPTPAPAPAPVPAPQVDPPPASLPPPGPAGGDTAPVVPGSSSQPPDASGFAPQPAPGGSTAPGTDAAPRTEPRKAPRPSPAKPRRESGRTQAPPPPPSVDDSRKSAEQLRREIEEELRGVTRKN